MTIEEIDAATPAGDLTLAQAISALNDLHCLGDAIYDVRRRAVEGEAWGPWEGSSWDHPAVKRYAELFQHIDALVQEKDLPPLDPR